jgi:FHS family L-fucose permease-like MFS transporter
MSNQKNYIFYAIPVLLSFFVMSFCDLVGVGVDNAKADFKLSNTLAQMIPMAVFAWFFLLSVPVGVLQERIGKRNMLNIGMILTAAGLMLPFLLYTFPVAHDWVCTFGYRQYHHPGICQSVAY